MADRLVDLVRKWRLARQAIFDCPATPGAEMWRALAKAEQELMAYSRDEAPETKDG